MKIAKEVNSKTKVFKFVSAQDFFIIIIYLAITAILKTYVNESLIIPYWIFSIVMAIIMTCPSLTNKKRKVWQSIFLLMKKDVYTYKPVLNISKQRGVKAHEKEKGYRKAKDR